MRKNNELGDLASFRDDLSEEDEDESSLEHTKDEAISRKKGSEKKV